MKKFFAWLKHWWWNLRHPKKTYQVNWEKKTKIPVTWAPRRRKEDAHTKKLRKMAERSRKINRRK